MTALAFLLVAALDGTLRLEGTICRMNRELDRLIVAADDGTRLSVLVPGEVAMTFDSTPIEREDVRPGARLVITGTLDGERVEASAADVQVRVGNVLFDMLVGPPKTLTGRFGLREAETEYFQFRLEGGKQIRVDAKSASGAGGRAWVKDLRTGDLLELGGEWTKPGEFRASYIKNITDEEPLSCSSLARKDESKDQTALRRAAERRFLDGYDEKE